MPEISNLFGPGGRGVSAANARDVEPIHIPALPVSPATGGQKPEDRVAAEARAAAALPATGETRRANVSIELTITEHRSDGPVQKTVTMLVSDRQNGSIRRQGVGGPAPAGTLNLDARPTVSADNSVLVYLSFVFLPGQQGRVGRDEPDSITELHESLTVLVTSGKPLLISEISDPAGNRRLVVQLKATVLP
jgi:hypothetical protein